MKARITVLALVIYSLSGFTSVFAANLQVPDFRLISRGFVEDGSFLLSTRADASLLIEGGMKFGGELGLGFSQTGVEETTELPDSYNPDSVAGYIDRTLRFESASVFIRELFGSPLDVTYFTGRIDRFASGRAFEDRFGTSPFATDFRGFRYFADGVLYDGLHRVNGTGLKLGTSSLAEWLYLAGYTYQNLNIDPGVYGSDLRALFNFDRIKLETFVGSSYPQGDYGAYRGGLMLFFDTGAGGEFFTQLGVPYWEPGSSDDFGIEDFYFRFEPRIRFENFSIILSLFWHPEYYLEQRTGERGAVDTNVKFLIGDPEQSPVRAGLDNAALYRPSADEQLRVTVSPFVSVTTAGVVWDFTLQTQVYPFSIESAFEGFLGIETAF